MLRRIFSTAPGAYSPSTQFANREGWSKPALDRLYRARIGHAYGNGDEGEPDGAAFTANLDTVDAAVFSRSSSAYGLLDTPMPAAYLGGLSMAVRQETGRTIDSYIANEQASGEPRVEMIDRFYARERDSRYLNPEWIRAMQASGYNGARYMADLTDSMSLWEQMRPELVSDRDWEAVRDVYLRDRYDLGMDRYFARHNPAARAKLVETLLEAIARGDWAADDAARAELRQMASRETAGSISPAKEVRAAPSRAQAKEAGAPTSSRQAAATPASGGARISGYELRPATAMPEMPSNASPNRTPVIPGIALLLSLLVAGLAIKPHW